MRRADRRCDGPPAGLEYEVRAARGGSLLKRRTVVLAFTLWAYVVLRFGIKVAVRAEELCAAGGGEFRLRKYDDAYG